MTEPTPIPPPSALGRAVAAADAAYRFVTVGDRPPESDRRKSRLLAGLLSAVLPGAGQLYNFQLSKAVAIAPAFAAAAAAAGIALAAQGTSWSPNSRGALLTAAGVVAGGVWLLAVSDAAATAHALRRGRLIVRYSLRRQWWLLGARFLPYVGAFVPSETVRAEEYGQPPTAAARGLAGAHARDRFLWGPLRMVGVSAGVAVAAAGVAYGLPVVAGLGAVIVLAAVARSVL